MSDWNRFLECVPWFVEPGESVVVGEAAPWTRGSVPGLPELSALLAAATVTPVSVAGRSYELLAWGPDDHRRGWLCLPPRPGAGDEAPRTLRDFWSVCGGIVGLFNQPTTWWLNQDEVLTASDAPGLLTESIDAYSWIWEHNDLEAPIERVRDYVTVAIEANGSMTVAHRETGHLLLFAPDHDFDGITPWSGCPEYSLYTFDELPDLAAWVEMCAAAWR